MGILEGILGDASSSRSLIELYRDRLSTEALICRVLRHSEDIVLVAKMDKDQTPDGLAACRTSDISRIRIGTRRLEIEASMSEWPDAFVVPDVGFADLASTASALHRVFGHVTIYTERIDEDVVYIGDAIQLDNEFLFMNEFGTIDDLSRSGLAIRISDITRVEAGGNYERRLLRAHQAHGQNVRPK